MEQKNECDTTSYDSFTKRINDIGIFKELQCFQLFFNDEMLESLVEESNNYYRKILIEKYGNDYRDVILNAGTFSTYPHLYVTRGIEKEDILAFIGVRIYMGFHKYPSLEDYWNKDILYKNVLKEIMPKNYYFLIAKAIHFPEKEKKKDETCSSTTEGDSSCDNNTGKIDPRYKINLYLEKLAQNFQKYYDLGENITIDESLIQFKGRNSMKFYIPMKPHKWGFKIHLLCDADTHYLYNMLFDPGRGGKNFICSDDCASLSESIVLKLLSCIKDTDKKKRNVFFDGWYSSISLMKKLTKLGFLNTTVLRANSKELPPKIKLEGYDKAYSDEILIQKYEGKKTILFATNYKIDKEELRNIYNIKNRGVDTFDQLLAISSSQRRTKKWYKKVFLFGIDAAIINAKIIFESKTGKSLKTLKFKENLCRQIFKMYTSSSRSNIKIKYSRPYKMLNSYQHSIERVEEEKPCKGCQRNASHMCLQCNIYLHPDCFEQYHRRFVYRNNLPNNKLPYQKPPSNPPGQAPLDSSITNLDQSQTQNLENSNNNTTNSEQTTQNMIQETPTPSVNQEQNQNNENIQTPSQSINLEQTQRNMEQSNSNQNPTTGENNQTPDETPIAAADIIKIIKDQIPNQENPEETNIDNNSNNDQSQIITPVASQEQKEDVDKKINQEQKVDVDLKINQEQKEEIVEKINQEQKENVDKKINQEQKEIKDEKVQEKNLQKMEQESNINPNTTQEKAEEKMEVENKPKENVIYEEQTEKK